MGLDSCLVFEDPPIVGTGKALRYEGYAKIRIYLNLN